MSLANLRNKLTAVDDRLIELIAERQRIVGEISAEKLADGRPTRDFEREKTVLSGGRDRAIAQGVDPDLAEEVLAALIRSSLTSQEQERVAAQAAGNGRRVLVIGGAGKMGQWFVDFFASQGFETTVADPSLSDTAGGHRDWRDAGVDFDAIVVATPLAVSAKVLSELADLEPAGLVFDIGSLKTPLRAGLKKLAACGCQVTSLHPMYGPDTRLLSGRHMIFVDVGMPEATRAAKDLFAATMVEQLDMDVDDHDRLIAYVLGLSHALNIAFFTALAESGEAAPQLAKLSSTTFDAQLAVSDAVAHDNPRLYFEIQSLNEYGLDPLDALCESAKRIRAVIAEADEEEFVELMHNGRRYLASRR